MFFVDVFFFCLLMMNGDRNQLISYITVSCDTIIFNKGRHDIHALSLSIRKWIRRMVDIVIAFAFEFEYFGILSLAIELLELWIGTISDEDNPCEYENQRMFWAQFNWHFRLVRLHSISNGNDIRFCIVIFYGILLTIPCLAVLSGIYSVYGIIVWYSNFPLPECYLISCMQIPK